jgi:anti-sigma B factor antagonist
MQPQSEQHLLEMEQIGEVTVVRFTRRSILAPQLIESVGRELLGLVAQEGCRRVVLNFGRVESVGSAMVGKLIQLLRHVEARGGHLAFCRVDKFLMEIFKILEIPRLVRIYGEEQEALEGV